MKLSDGLPGSQYVTEQGFLLTFIRDREDGDVVVRSESSGHEILLSGDTPVTIKAESSDIVIGDDSQMIETRKTRLFNRLLQESEVTVESLVDVTPFSKSDIKTVIAMETQDALGLRDVSAGVAHG